MKIFIMFKDYPWKIIDSYDNFDDFDKDEKYAKYSKPDNDHYHFYLGLDKFYLHYDYFKHNNIPNNINHQNSELHIGWKNSVDKYLLKKKLECILS